MLTQGIEKQTLWVESSQYFPTKFDWQEQEKLKSGVNEQTPPAIKFFFLIGLVLIACYVN